MPFGRSASRRRQAARHHLRTQRTCPRCLRQIRGNAYAKHKKACQRAYAAADRPPTDTSPPGQQRATAQEVQMGSHNVSHRVPANIKSEAELRSYWSRFIEQEIYEHGTDPYNGTFSTTRGLDISSKVFDSVATADEYILEHTEKWEAAMAARVKVVEIDYRTIETDEKFKALRQEQRDAEAAEINTIGALREGLCKGAATRACRTCGSKIAMRWTAADGKTWGFRDFTCPVCKTGILLLKGEKSTLDRAKKDTLKAQEKTNERRKALQEKLAKGKAANEFWYVAGWAAC